MRVGAKRSKPAATAVWVVKRFPARVTASATAGLRCEVAVTQIPSGDVIDVQVRTCNGDEAVVRSIEQAVLRASPLPQPPTPALFNRNLIVNFQPDE